jgi:hypothetical protein
VTIADRATDRAAGALQGAADVVLGVRHQVASDDLSGHPRGREAAARERWHAGQPARNAFERDTYLVLENDAAAGMNRLERLGKQASQMEAGMAAPAGPEAGQ